MRIRRALEIVLGLIVVLLLWEIGAAWRRPLPTPLPAPTAPLDSGTHPFPPVLMTPESVASQVQAIADKNLFDPNRGRVDASVVKEEGPKEVPLSSHLKLVGVVVSHGRTEAMFTDASQGGKAVRVKEGDALGAYQLTRVTPTAVKLALGAGGGEVTLSLALLSSSQAGAASQMVPVTPQPNKQNIQRRPAVRGAPQPAAPNPDDNAAPQEETQDLRENIQKMQQRLRQIRRRAAIEEARSRGEFTEEEEEEEE